MFIYIYVYIDIYVYIHIYREKCRVTFAPEQQRTRSESRPPRTRPPLLTRAYIHLYLYIHIHKYILTYMCTVYNSLFIFLHIHMNIYIYMLIYVYIYICLYTHILPNRTLAPAHQRKRSGSRPPRTRPLLLMYAYLNKHTIFAYM